MSSFTNDILARVVIVTRLSASRSAPIQASSRQEGLGDKLDSMISRDGGVPRQPPRTGCNFRLVLSQRSHRRR